MVMPKIMLRETVLNLSTVYVLMLEQSRNKLLQLVCYVRVLRLVIR